MNHQLSFSVGIPAYKGFYLSQCIQSILNQTYPVFELIIINDCSPDPIDSIVEQFMDHRIKYFKNAQNTGAVHLANNYNRCLEKATGDFFILMGDDDQMAPNYLEEFHTLIQKHPSLDVFHCRSLIIDEHSNPIIYTPSWPEQESVYDNIWHRMNGYRVQFIADYVYRTASLKQHNGFYYMPLGWYTDDITSYIAMRKNGIAHTNQPVLNYRTHAANISSVGNYQLKMQAIIEQEDWFNEFLREPPLNKEDEIIYDSLCKNMGKLMNNHKIEAISSSLEGDFYRSVIKWLKSRKKFNLTLLTIVKAMIKYLKVKNGNKSHRAL